MMNLTWCGDTHTCRRPNNEDAFAMQEVTGYLSLFVVADGLGGHVAGEVASRLAVSSLVDAVRSYAPADVPCTPAEMREFLRKGFVAATRAIADDCARHPEHTGMATTLLGALINDVHECVIAHIGDSRAYIRDTTLVQVTNDHSFVQELYERGLITRDELRIHPDKNIVTRIVNGVPADPDFTDLPLGNRTLLLCTDGLTDALPDEEISGMLQDPDVPRICRTLIERSRTVNRDNTTVIVVRILPA
jgi:protein phosphatase